MLAKYPSLFFCIWISIVNLSASDDVPLEVQNNIIVKLNSLILPSKEVFSENVLKDMLPNVNAFIFEYRSGARVPGDELLLGDTKSWKFPRQDVAMGINYPENLDEGNSTYCITQFRVFISQDSGQSQGYMMSGGPGRQFVELKFIASDAKYLSYDLRLFGIHYDLLRNCSEIFNDTSQ